jgi:hypothetical protein
VTGGRPSSILAKMYERRGQPLLPRRQFVARLLRHAAFTAGLVAGSLLAGMLGYHYLEGLHWLDAFLNAAMILGGMGPVAPLQTRAGKLFAGLYALYAGMVLLIALSILLLPVLHRLLHSFHLDEPDDDDPQAPG